MYGGGGGGGGNRVSGSGGVSVGVPSTAGLSYADSVRSRAAFDSIGRPLRPSYHHQHHPRLQQQQQQQQQQQYEGAGVLDTLRPAGDMNSTISRLQSLQAELQSRDDAVARGNDQQLVARRDKVRVMPGTHRRRRRDSTRQLSRVGVRGVYWA